MTEADKTYSIELTPDRIKKLEELRTSGYDIPRDTLNHVLDDILDYAIERQRDFIEGECISWDRDVAREYNPKDNNEIVGLRFAHSNFHRFEDLLQIHRLKDSDEVLSMLIDFWLLYHPKDVEAIRRSQYEWDAQKEKEQKDNKEDAQ